MDQLFRQEALEHRRKRLHGNIIISRSGTAGAVVLALVAVVVAVAFWLALGSFARIETARGALVTVAPSAKVISTAPGIVVELNAEDGGVVEKGDHLATVTLDRRAQDGRGLAGDSLLALDERIALTQSQVRLESARLAGEQARLSAALDGAEDDAAQLDEQIAIQERLVASAGNMLEKIIPVVERGYVTQIELERRRQAHLTAQQALANLKQQQLSAVSRARQARAELSVLASQSATQIDELNSGRLALQQQQSQLRGEEAYSLIAPISGKVTAIQTAVGRSVSGGGTVMTIVPEATILRAEVYAPSRGIGLLKIGQEARLLFDAFPYQRFGSFGGRIRSISLTAIDPSENETRVEAQEPVYRVVIDLDNQDVRAFGTKSPLQPGMTLTANLVLERQSFLSWLLTPLRAVVNRSQ